ncbi:MAG: sporulation protein [Rhodobacterales bacterium]|nr:MAG: sporulation protein [Rhodobacterales bacterium]
MADIPAAGPMVGPRRAKSIATAANWAGAVVSVSLVVGIGVWGYKTLARDVSGVPVVRAASGDPMRIQPEDPGGRPALNQGLAVNDVAAEGSAAKPADRLILAPAPVNLTDEDAPQGKEVMLAPVDPAPKPAPTAVKPAPGTEPLSPQMASIRALAEQLSAGAVPLDVDESSTPAPEVTASVAPVAAGISDATVIAGKGVVRSLRPVLRPASLNTVSVAAPAAPSIDVDPANVPAGTRLVQLGAFDSPEVARREWDKLSARFGDYIEGKQRVVQRAKSGGRVFYRLRAMGFADLNDARRFCSALVAERADCIPVVTR